MRRKNIKPAASRVKIHPRLRMTQSRATDETSKTCCGAIIPQAMKATTAPPTAVRMTLSTP